MKSGSKRRSMSNEQLTWYLNKLKPILDSVVASTSYKLLEVSFTKENEINFLRITIDNDEQTITLNDCEEFSRRVDRELDKANLIPFSYNLEVQSPGKAEKEDKCIR